MKAVSLCLLLGFVAVVLAASGVHKTNSAGSNYAVIIAGMSSALTDGLITDVLCRFERLLQLSPPGGRVPRLSGIILTPAKAQI